MSFLSNIKAELLKTRRTNARWLTLIGAAFIPAVNVIKLLGRPDVFVSKMKDNTWTLFINDNWAIAAGFLLPVYIILLISLMAQLEYGNNTWKQVYTTPRSFADIFFSKFLVIHFLIISCFILFTVLVVAAGYAVGVINPDYPFLSNPVPWSNLVHMGTKMYQSILAITAIQYWLSVRLKNFITPLGIGLALLIGGFMIRQWEYIAYYPYMQPLLAYFENPGLESGTADKAILNSMLYCAGVLALGFYDLTRRKVLG